MSSDTTRAWDDLLQACRVASAASYAEGERAATERIAAWLRDMDNGGRVSQMWVADAIERGEHKKGNT